MTLRGKTCCDVKKDMYSRHHKKVPVPYSFYDCKTLRSVKRYDAITGANRKYGSPIYFVIAPFIRAYITPVREALYAGMNKCLLTMPIVFVNNRRQSMAKLCEAQNHSIAKEN